MLHMEQVEKVHSEKINSKRIEYVDYVKGIGILLVVIGHHMLDAENVIIWINSFHMPLFFVITGYLSELKKADVNQGKSLLVYAKKRAESVLYPYFTFSVINLLWYLLFHHFLGFSADENLKIVALRTITTFGYHALWFLPTMFCASVICFFGEQKGLFCPCGQKSVDTAALL